MQTIVEMKENKKKKKPTHTATARVANRASKYRIVPYLTESTQKGHRAWESNSQTVLLLGDSVNHCSTACKTNH